MPIWRCRAESETLARELLDRTVRAGAGGRGGLGGEQLDHVASMILTSAKYNHVAPDNRSLTVAKTK